MAVLTLLSAELLHRVTHVVGGDSVVAVKRAHELLPALQVRPIRSVVIDPMLVPTEDRKAYAAFVRSALMLPFAYYTHLKPANSRAVLDLLALKPAPVILANVDDTPLRLLSALRDEQFRITALQVVERLTVGRTYEPFHAALVDLFEYPQQFNTTLAAFAAHANMTLRTLQRHLTRLGCRRPLYILHASRLLRGYLLYQTRNHSIADIVETLGYGSSQTMVLQCRTLLNTTPKRAFSLAAQDFMTRLVSGLLADAALPQGSRSRGWPSEEQR